MSIEILTDVAAAQDVAGQPANILLYGGPGVSKTSDAVAAFCKDGRCNAFAIPFEDGALKAPAARGLPVPDHPKQTVKSWTAFYETFAWLSQNRQRYCALLLDGFSVFTTMLYKEAEATKKGWDIPLQVRGQLLQLRQWIRDIGLHCVITAHPIMPGFVDGIFMPGGFSLQPKSLIGEWFGQIDSVLRVDYVYNAAPNPVPPNYKLGEPTRVYFTGGTSWVPAFEQPADWRLWRTKNREGCNSAIVPADLGTFLRARQPAYWGL